VVRAILGAYPRAPGHRPAPFAPRLDPGPATRAAGSVVVHGDRVGDTPAGSAHRLRRTSAAARRPGFRSHRGVGCFARPAAHPRRGDFRPFARRRAPSPTWISHRVRRTPQPAHGCPGLRVRRVAGGAGAAAQTAQSLDPASWFRQERVAVHGGRAGISTFPGPDRPRQGRPRRIAATRPWRDKAGSSSSPPDRPARPPSAFRRRVGFIGLRSRASENDALPSPKASASATVSDTDAPGGGCSDRASGSRATVCCLSSLAKASTDPYSADPQLASGCRRHRLRPGAGPGTHPRRSADG
jgi:hypothetical protein